MVIRNTGTWYALESADMEEAILFPNITAIFKPITTKCRHFSEDQSLVDKEINKHLTNKIIEQIFRHGVLNSSLFLKNEAKSHRMRLFILLQSINKYTEPDA